MNSSSRSRNSIRNAIIGIICQFVILLSSFISRTIFINQLGAEYLGINGLFTNILTVLSLTELGIGNILLYSLYKPIYEKDFEKISIILNYFKKLYYWIATGIFFLGILIVPSLKYIAMTSTINYHELFLYYSLFLINSVISYFIVHKTILINADQRIYIVQTVNTATLLVRDICQIIILLFTGSYFLYLIIQIITTISNNIIINFVANKMYPYVLAKSNKLITEFTDKVEIIKNIKAVFIYRVGVILMNYTDNILISIILGTIVVGYYTNYFLIISSIMSFINILIQSLYSSIGNRNASQDRDSSYSLFRFLVLLFHWIAAISSACILITINDFITIWIGEQYVLSIDVLISIIVNFYVQVVISPVWVYRETLGLFYKVRYVMIIAAIINILFSIIFGKVMGLSGIIISTALARILTNVWYEPYLLFKLNFEKPTKTYWILQAKYFFITLISFATTIWLSNQLGNSVTMMFVKIGVIATITSLLFLILNLNTLELKMARLYWLELYNKIRRS